tara:strand:- start:41352 stop:42128 length:777 start_codon:yes stop_codon:yes gene_type:complete
MKESGYGRLESTCNPDTVSDGRGGIFTWVPEEPIEKYRMIHCNPVTKVREEHTSKSKEYLLITGGSGAIVFKEPSRDREVFHVSKGDCIYASPGIAHTVVPITPLTGIEMLTERGDESETGYGSESETGYGLIKPTCNIDASLDGSGGIFTWVPNKAIKEFSLIYYTPGTVRGEHHHPEFIEYLLILDGSGQIVFKEPSRDREVVPLSKGDCIYASPGIAHTVVPITPLSAVAMLTKKWDDCEEPITKVTITGNSGEE